ncbi:hypothetical protein [Plantactinospora sp. GCM10030261]|uniref:hypothetical protein n=1 Tax=Plantactinospora sp. GCM10030261 TaxID=3273420 RepID=UPI003614DB63
MRAATRSGGDYRGRHQAAVLARFQPTWRQAFARGLAAGALLLAAGLSIAGMALLLVPDEPAGRDVGRPATGRSVPHRFGPTVLLAGAPPGLGLFMAVAHRRWATARLDVSGMRTGGGRRGGFVPWDRVTDIRAERRRRRTVVVVYGADGVVRRLRAPYDGELLAHDPRFERKLFLIQHLWETHRSWSIPGRAPTGPSVA